MEAEVEKLFQSAGKDAEEAWQNMKPFVEEHIAQLFGIALDQGLKIVQEKESSEHNPIRKLELKAVAEVFSLLKEAMGEGLIQAKVP